MDLNNIIGIVLIIPFYLFFMAQFAFPVWLFFGMLLGHRLEKFLLSRGWNERAARKTRRLSEYAVALLVGLFALYIIANVSGDSGPPHSRYQAKVYGW